MGEKIIATNRKARHDYHILGSIEAGIALVGTEVKSLREGKANLKESYAIIEDHEAYIVGLHISPYSHGTTQPHDPTRRRKLLLNRSELRRLHRQVEQKGVTLIPLRLYFKDSWVKVDLGMATGKAKHDKRHAIADRDAKRDMDRASKMRRQN